jgi:hypothetical protein
MKGYGMKARYLILAVVMLGSLALHAQSFPHPSTEVTWNASPNGVAYNV